MRPTAFYPSARRLLWRRLKPRTRGVKVMLFDSAERILLIRNAYGDTSAFVLPGGGLRLFESPEEAARREIKEEIGCALRGLEICGIYQSQREGKRDSIWLFSAHTTDVATPDLTEVAEARFFSLEELPATASPATRRRLSEFQGLTARDGTW